MIACLDAGCILGTLSVLQKNCIHAQGPVSNRAVVQMLVAGWKALGMVGRGQFVGIMGFASMDWLVSDIATTYTGGIMSPLPTNILVEDIKHLILEAEVRLVWGAPI